MSKYSVITCVSNPDIYERCLLRSIYAQDSHKDVELIPIINNDNRYSASLALNIGIESARTDHLIIAHQDVRLLGDWFNTLDKILETHKGWGIIGCAGILRDAGIDDIGVWGGTKGKEIAVGTVYDNDENATKGNAYWCGIKDAVPVHCIDECLFVVNAKTRLRFDTLYTGFHFYGVDMCLQARSAGYQVIGSELPIVHYGRYSASMYGNHKYWKYFRYMHHKWSERFPVLLGTHMHWSKDGFTSYINMELDDNHGNKIGIKSMGIKKLELIRSDL